MFKHWQGDAMGSAREWTNILSYFRGKWFRDVKSVRDEQSTDLFGILCRIWAPKSEGFQMPKNLEDKSSRETMGSWKIWKVIFISFECRKRRRGRIRDCHRKEFLTPRSDNLTCRELSFDCNRIRLMSATNPGGFNLFIRVMDAVTVHVFNKTQLWDL